MFRLLVVGIVTYLGYSLFLRLRNKRKQRSNIDQKKSIGKFSKMKIRDAEFKDIEEKDV